MIGGNGLYDTNEILLSRLFKAQRLCSSCNGSTSELMKDKCSNCEKLKK